MHKKIILSISSATFLAALFSVKNTSFPIEKSYIENPVTINSANIEIISENDNTGDDIKAVFADISANTTINARYHINNYNKAKDSVEDYICGVVAAEMPPSFDDEALKAQAVAARTYFINTTDNIENIIPENILQSYVSVAEMKELWKDKFDEYYSKIRQCVDSTSGIIMIYENEPVMAVFHSMSAGITQSSGDVWTQDIAYLKSRSCEFEKSAPNFETVTEIPLTEFNAKIQSIGCDPSEFQICETSSAGYVKKIAFGEKIVKGDDIRRLFSLRSTCFNITVADNKAIFDVKGYGHGVGMSQYGANILANSGASYSQILKYYYSGVDLAHICE